MTDKLLACPVCFHEIPKNLMPQHVLEDHGVTNDYPKRMSCMIWRSKSLERERKELRKQWHDQLYSKLESILDQLERTRK